MSSSAKKITQTFNGRSEWHVGGGGYFKILTTVNPIDVELYHSGRQVLLAPQVDGGFYQRVAFDRVVVTTGALEAVSFLVAPDEGGSDTFSGVVDVADDAARLLGTLTAWRGKNRLYSPGFLLYAANTAVAGNFSRVQLWNPVASGLNLYVDSVRFVGEASSRAFLAAGVATLGTLVSTGANKTMGGAASAGEVRIGVVAALTGNNIEFFRGPASPYTERIVFEEPIIVPPGFGLTVQQSVANQLCEAVFEWREGA